MYELAELCDRAGVTPRTVRYYIQQGLLPAPGTRGPGTRYDERHLNRLLLIRRLQRDHLPLAEIRRRLEALDDDALRAQLQAEPEPPRPSSALDYVRGVLGGGARGAGGSAAMSEPPPMMQSLRRPVGAERAAPGEGEPLLARAMPASPSMPAPGAGKPGAVERSQWERITLAPDVELHVRRPLAREQNKLVDRLVHFARTLFAEDS